MGEKRGSKPADAEHASMSQGLDAPALREPESVPDSHSRSIARPSGSYESTGSLPPESLPPESSSAHQAEVRAGVRTLMELQQIAILRVLGRILLFVMTPIASAIFVYLVASSSLSLFFSIELACLYLATFSAARRTLNLTLRRAGVCVGVMGVAIMSLCHFGPLMGTGLIYVGAVLVAALLAERREAFIVAGVLIASLATVGWLATIPEPGISYPEGEFSRATWLRVFVASSACIWGVLYLFLQVQRSLWRSVEKEIALRFRERRLVAEREKVLRGAASAQRLESLGRLAGGVAHDFNNALVVIQCGVESLADELEAHEREEVVSEIATGVERAAGTARQLLSFAKRNVEEIGECAPTDVIERLARESRRLLPAHITLELELDDTPRIAVSGTALEQMVLNLLQNARDALQVTGGTVRISVAREASTGGLLLTVVDDGPGMTSEVAERVFEPFFTTKGDRGTGLGLATVWGMVQRHGGEVTLDTAPEQGTRVGLHLPAAEAVSTQELAAHSEPSPHSTAHARVLVLEDEAPVRAALRRVLRHTGFDVVEAATVAEARHACQEQRFSILISDGVVPDGGVGTFIHEFRAQQNNAPVILCSGYLEEDLALDGIARGDCAYLAKPFSPSELTKLMHKLLPDSKISGTRKALNSSS